MSTSAAAWRSHRLWLVTAFIAVHIAVLLLGRAFSHDMSWGDVGLYSSWVDDTLSGQAIPSFDTPWVYPPGALVPLLLAKGLSALSGDYPLGWFLLVVILNAAAVYALLRTGLTRRAGRTAAWWFLGFLLLFGPIGVARLDAITVALVTLALTLVLTRPWWGASLLAAAAWIKVWPAALLAPAALVVGWRRIGVVLAPLLALGGIFALLIVLFGSNGSLLGFLTAQQERSVQVESVTATPFLWWHLLGGEAQAVYDDSLVTWNVVGPGVPFAATLADIAMSTFVAVALGLLVRAWYCGSHPADLLATGALLLPLVLFATNKVGSPQYVTWMAPAVAIALAWRLSGWAVPAAAVAVIAGLTQVVCAFGYQGLLSGELWPLLLLTIRNLALLAVLGWALHRTWRLPARSVRLPAPIATHLKEETA